MLVVVSEQFSRFSELAEQLTERSIFLLHCPLETAEFICDKHDTGGVLLDLTLRPKEGCALLSRLKERFPELPIAVISSKELPPWLRLDRVVRICDDRNMERNILAFCLSDCHFYIGTICGKQLTVGNKTAFYKNRPLALTASQYRVLRCLAYRAPHMVETDLLLSMCFPNEMAPPSKLAFLVHGINERARQLELEPPIVSLYGRGYCIREGVIV